MLRFERLDASGDRDLNIEVIGVEVTILQTERLTIRQFIFSSKHDLESQGRGLFTFQKIGRHSQTKASATADELPAAAE